MKARYGPGDAQAERKTHGGSDQAQTPEDRCRGGGDGRCVAGARAAGGNEDSERLYQKRPPPLRGDRFNTLEAFKAEFRCIYADMRNSAGQSRGPLEVDRPWDS